MSESPEPKTVNTPNIRETDGFKLFYKEIIMPRIAKQGELHWIMFDNIGDQCVLPDDNPGSHVYQYKEYLKTKSSN